MTYFETPRLEKLQRYWDGHVYKAEEKWFITWNRNIKTANPLHQSWKENTKRLAHQCITKSRIETQRPNRTITDWPLQTKIATSIVLVLRIYHIAKCGNGRETAENYLLKYWKYREYIYKKKAEIVYWNSKNAMAGLLGDTKLIKHMLEYIKAIGRRHRTIKWCEIYGQEIGRKPARPLRN